MSLTEWLMFFTALGAFFAAWASALGARATEHGVKVTETTTKAQLLSSLYNEYWSDIYLESVNTLDEWHKKHSDESAKKLAEMKRQRNSLPENDQREFDQVDKARRRVKSYFRKTQQFCTAKYLAETDIKKLLCPEWKIPILFDSIEPLDYEINPEYVREMYDFFDGLHGRKIPRPLRDLNITAKNQMLE